MAVLIGLCVVASENLQLLFDFVIVDLVAWPFENFVSNPQQQVDSFVHPPTESQKIDSIEQNGLFILLPLSLSLRTLPGFHQSRSKLIVDKAILLELASLVAVVCRVVAEHASRSEPPIIVSHGCVGVGIDTFAVELTMPFEFCERLPLQRRVKLK